ncbi:membrane-anchored ubiquitin-fold protein 1-like isoform X1 [Malus sylvestris]|uniref:membrane-anchored ubiquitin-fold protein 1-like isoform X1 n=1 Tax=Malus sylvestris TaxID=3752 RepID=UPI0021ACBA10|nr:membrane-anchored ubiquitin-fold protein 1-like isoform X1 [Malus sylvestris]
MAGVQDQLEIKFRLTDGSDIGPKSFPAATTVVNLKESILAQWPKEKDNGPRTVKDVKLICAGRVLENNKTVAECRSPLCDVPGGVTTMHVVVQPPSQEKAHASPFWKRGGGHLFSSLSSFFNFSSINILLFRLL